MRQAMAGCDAKEWRDAVAYEIRAMIKNDTWTLVDRPQNHKVVDSRIVLRNKFDSNGNIERRKARLVAQGFSQQPGIHFHETFAPVARISTIRLVASIAAEHGMTIRQFDVETAYLNGELEERVYMETPKSIDSILQDIVDSESDTFIKTKATDMLNEVRKGDKVCLLKKSLYGLRQAGRSWHRKLSATLMELGASPSKSDPCLYLVGSGKNLMLITIYVDDLLIAARNERPIIEFGKKLAKRFTMKDLGKARYCLGIEIGQEDGKVSMHQRGYTREILDRFGMSNCKSVTTPMDIGAKLKKNETPNKDDLKLPYRELVGALTYLSSTTRPDIAFAVSYLGQFNNCFGSEHWKAAKRVSARHARPRTGLREQLGSYQRIRGRRLGKLL